MRVLIVDDSPEFSSLMRRYLARSFPDVEVSEYDPEQRGRPGAEFDWSLYDVLLLDHDLGSGETGVEWLREFRSRPGFPATILCTSNEDPYVAVEAVQLGARHYLSKADLSPARLRQVIDRTLADENGDRAVHDSGDSATDLASLFATVPGNRTLLRTESGGGYRFVRLIGQGAYSRVYLAERSEDRATLVLKILGESTSGGDREVRRFVQEAELLAGIDNPRVVKIHEHGFINDCGYIAMEFFSGGDLKQRIGKGFTPEEAASCMADIARGLAAIHDVGIIHRDLKPGNIMFRADGSLAIADFGISKRINSTSDLTSTGELLGTPNYMSPEQIQALDTDQRTDLYSAGVIFFEMLTGSKPFVFSNAGSLLFAHIHAPVPRLPEALQRFQPVVDRLLAKSPAERFPHAPALVEALVELGAGGRVRPPGA